MVRSSLLKIEALPGILAGGRHVRADRHHVHASNLLDENQ